VLEDLSIWQLFGSLPVFIINVCEFVAENYAFRHTNAEILLEIRVLTR